MTENHPITSLELTSHFCGECSPERASEIKAHADNCLVCRRLLKELEEQKRSFLAQHPTMETDSVPSGPQVNKRWRTAYAVAAALILLVAGSLSYRTMVGADGYRTKGGSGLELFVLGDSGQAEKRTNGVFHPGERIQLTYSCAERNHFVLLSVDTAGAVSVFYPSAGDSSVVLKKGQKLPLPHSIELDSYLGKELYVGVFSEKTLPLHVVKDGVSAALENDRELADVQLSFGAGTTVETILITKQERTR
jgi:hypothetical protein